MIPGEYILRTDPITCNEQAEAKPLQVTNRGDRPIQVGSHYHFLEVNSALEFDRGEARGYRLDIPAGTAVRFEPGDAKTIKLIKLSGTREVHGFQDQVNGPLDAGSAGEGRK
ncbi:urease subunit beta [Arthrobacter wenxiniae]|jgi:urease subunit beta|uniref:Urease subunit beta n=1 Tax=Arthrobacter wenxiniae TaxID=2713570 RepID=A0A7Y7IGE2_9MICC|nr:urease subunit beta [Arthrobacter wenxiniae]NVM94952.1 urease subunit beta [Arthrobacter wenxiniae]